MRSPDRLQRSPFAGKAKQSPPVHSAGDDDHPGRVQSTSMQIQVLCLSVSITGERSSGVNGGVSVYQAPLHGNYRKMLW